MGLSRLYLQVHYPSGVLGGWALAVAWTLWV
ncbi:MULTISPECIES: phosphatase PAP2 family protein [Thermus]